MVLQSPVSRRQFVAGAGALGVTIAADSGQAAASVSDPTQLTAVDLRRAIDGRKFSCREVMQAYLARIEHGNARFNAIVALRDPELLLREADAADAMLAKVGPMGPLHGFPMAPKDAAATKGIVTTFGSPIFRNNVPGEDGLMVSRLRSAGAIFVGKTNIPEFGLGSQTYNSVYGTTGNAWDEKLTAGGSSGGAAVALAQRMLPVADGSDMMGSLRNPAGWNNVVGLRPTMGLVPSWPSDDVFFQQFAYEGPMGRTVRDAAFLLSVQAGPDPRTPLSYHAHSTDFAKPLDRNLRGARIGYLGDLEGHLAMEPGVLDLVETGLRHFETVGCSIETVKPGFDMERVWESWVALRAFSVSGPLGDHYDNGQARSLLKPEAVWEIETGQALTIPMLQRAIKSRTAWFNHLLKLMQSYDALVLPTSQTFAFPASKHWPHEVGGRTMDTYHRWMEVSAFASLVGFPSLALPCGFDSSRRAMGLQLIGKPKADLFLLQLGHAYEEASRFSRLSPA